MQRPNIMLLGGASRSGKTSIATEAVAMGANLGYSHLSIGNHMRDIKAGKVTSAYSDKLDDRPLRYGPLRVLAGEVMMGLFEEFIEQQDGAVTIVDGFPRFSDRLDPFRRSIKRLGIRVLGICQVEVEESVLRERSKNERGRVESAFEIRLSTHKEFIIPTLSVLAQEYPSFELDGTRPILENASNLFQICGGLRLDRTRTLLND